MSDYYQILGVAKTASIKEIKQSYKRLAKQYHPDKCSSSECEEKFKQINEAHTILSDDTTRKEYDLFGVQGSRNRFQEQDVDVNDILNSMFGSSNWFGQGRRKEPNLDLHIKIQLNIEDALKGTTIEIEGSKVKVPAKIINGSKLRLKEKGRRLHNKIGDLFIHIDIVNDVKYRLVGNIIYSILIIPLKQAIFGGRITFDYFGEELKVTIPKDVSFGQKLRLVGKGLGMSELILEIQYVLPKSYEVKEEDFDFLN